MKFLYLSAGLLVGYVAGYFWSSQQHSTATENVVSPVVPIVEAENNHDTVSQSDSIVVPETVITRDREFQKLTEEVERRLRVIESSHAAAVRSSEDTKQLMRAVKQTNEEFAIEAKAAAQENEEFRQLIQSYDPIWMGKDPKGFVEMVTMIWEEVSNENAKLRAQLADESEKGDPEN